jgi:glycosyltransferase involved in cell wall biosynthesis
MSTVVGPLAPSAPLLSVIVPVYNEERTAGELLRRLVAVPYPDKEILIVDDGSRDATPAVLRPWLGHPEVRLLRHEHNQGKGAAIRTGLAQARGRFTVIQDADLEYDPADLPRLVELLRQGQSTVVYGSRYLRPARPLPYTRFRLGVLVLNALVYVLYGRRLTDQATCYKVLPTALLRDLDLRARRFEFCAEVTAKVCRLGIPITEVPIAYQPRTAREGKKIGWRDFGQAVLTLLRYRFAPVRWGTAGARAPALTPAFAAGPAPSLRGL